MECLNDFTRITVGDATVFHGSNLDVLPFMADNSVDSIVTDPPYELGFMGKKWDSTGIAYSVELWAECLRVLKPGGHLLAFGGSRTWHRLAVAIEDAGFEVRDSIAWLYGSGFPKSLDISKAIDKAAGAEREVLGVDKVRGINGGMLGRADPDSDEYDGSTVGVGTTYVTAPATDEAKKWAGWGTALKPAFEPVVVARKPLIGTVAENVLTYGVGGLNIDASRIGTEERTNQPAGNKADSNGVYKFSNAEVDAFNGTDATTVQGRWPANIILDEYTAELLDEQSGYLHGDGNKKDVGIGNDNGYEASSYQMSYQGRANRSHNDSGGASRFFYVAKASKRDRNEGLDELPEVRHADRTKDDGVGGDNPRNRTNQAKQNFHPTVKPTDLMRYLIKLVTPASGIVLDPFTGSGSTGKAALLDGYKFVGIELTEDYLPIIQGRLEWANQQALIEAEKESEKLF